MPITSTESRATNLLSRCARLSSYFIGFFNKMKIENVSSSSKQAEDWKIRKNRVKGTVVSFWLICVRQWIPIARSGSKGWKGSALTGSTLLSREKFAMAGSAPRPD